MSFEAVKLGVVGSGSFGLLHATTLTDLAEARLVALVDRRPERLGLAKSARGWTDLDAAQIAWGDRTLASFSASFLTPAGMAPDGFDRLEVFGDGWMARIEPNLRPIQVWDDRAH